MPLRKRLIRKLMRSSAITNPISRAIMQICDVQLSHGNQVTVLQDGPQTYPAMLRDIARAQQTINFENYIFESDSTGWEFANALAERALAGVQVNLLYDAIGSANTSDDLWAFLRGAGVQVRAFRPLSEGLARAQIRDHRKLIIVDGRIGYVGGHCIGDCWSGHKPDEPAWRDTHCRIEGAAVRSLQMAFCECWIDAGGEECAMHDERYFPQLWDAGALDVLTITCGDDRAMREAYLQMVKRARRRISLTNAYFCPDEEIRSALKQAAQRGVRVRIIVPGRSDHDFMVTAARSTYSDLLQAGVEVYEYQPAVLHAKTALIDGCWATIGSCNLDNRSLAYNFEADIGVCGTRFVRPLEQVFKDDLRHCVPIHPERWRRRPLLQKLTERVVALFSSHL